MSTSAVGVAIVSYECASLLRRCLESVIADSGGPVVVVDNGSTDGSAELVRRNFPGVRLQVEHENRGYGAAANLAFGLLDTPYVLLLNADTEVSPGASRALASYLDDHPEAAIAGPRLVGVDGAYQPSAHRFPTPGALLVQEGGVGRLLGLGRREWQAGHVDWVLGAALAIRREAFYAVGGFDESYFLYQEEVDLCRRLRDSGWQTHYAPVATVLHVGGASTSRREPEMFAQFVHSTRRFARLHCSRTSVLAVRAVLAAVLSVRVARDTTLGVLARDREARARLRRRRALWLSGLATLWRSDDARPSSHERSR